MAPLERLELPTTRLEGAVLYSTELRAYIKRFFAILHIHTPCPYLIGLLSYALSTSNTCALTFRRIVCSDLSTNWGLYFYRRCSSPRRVLRPKTSLGGTPPKIRTLTNWVGASRATVKLEAYIWRRRSGSN